MLICIILADTAFAAPTTPIIPRADIPILDPSRTEMRLQESIDRKTRKPFVPERVPLLQPKVTSQVHMQKVLRFRLDGMRVSGATVYTSQELASIYHKYLGKMVSFKDVEKIAHLITLKYRHDGYILSRAIVPAQKIDDGVLRIKIVEGFVSQVNLQGKVNSSALHMLRKYANKIQESRPLKYKVLERYILLANDLTGLKVQGVFSPAKHQLGGSVLTLIIKQKQFHGSVEYNNLGTRYLGPQQIEAYMQLHGVFGTADNIELYGVKTHPDKELNFVGGKYARPLGSSGGQLFLTANQTRTNPGFLLEPLNLDGKNDMWMAGVKYPFIRSRAQNLYFGMDFKWIDSRTMFSRLPLFADRIRMLRVSGSYDFIDSYQGVDNLAMVMSQGLPIFNASRQDDVVPQTRSDAKRSFTKFNVEMTRLQIFNRYISGLLSFAGQYTNDPLLAAEEFGFGGEYWGKGYDPSEILGDRGIAGKAELMFNTYPGFSLLHYIQYYLFYHAGMVWNIGDYEFQSAQQAGSSAGLGMRMHFTKNFSGNFELAKPLTRKVLTEQQAGHSGKGIRGFFTIKADLEG